MLDVMLAVLFTIVPKVVVLFLLFDRFDAARMSSDVKAWRHGR